VTAAAAGQLSLEVIDVLAPTSRATSSQNAAPCSAGPFEHLVSCHSASIHTAAYFDAPRGQLLLKHSRGYSQVAAVEIGDQTKHSSRRASALSRRLLIGGTTVASAPPPCKHLSIVHLLLTEMLEDTLRRID